jgi:3-isopropylmalate/(R)-2-methylmalate dehydratase small subunit
MQPFRKLTAIAAPLNLINIDTDMIIPKLFLRTIKRTGLGKNLFDEMRYDDKGQEKPDFVLNREPYRHAEILVAGDNFGCGSSREHAPWALLDFGIRCVIAPSFADIFYGNCFNNGILPITLPQDQVEILMSRAQENPNEKMTVDLENKLITAGNHKFPFDLEEFKRHRLLNGLDGIGLTMEKAKDIDTYEAQNKTDRNWLWAKQ